MADTSRKLDFRIGDELFQRIEQARGFEPRASFVKRTLEEALLAPRKSTPVEEPMAPIQEKVQHAREAMSRAEQFRQASERKKT